MCNALFVARHISGATEYLSRKSGKIYRFAFEDGGITVECGKELIIWTEKLTDALRFVEQYDATIDLANLPKELSEADVVHN